MVDLPQKKVGIVACSGEELAEGTVTRLAALKVLEDLRPGETVTICLPLFLAGGEGDRAFARFYPTIAVDGCELRCAARATETYSGKPAASLVVTEIAQAAGLPRAQGLRRLDDAGKQTVELTAERIAASVDELIELRWNRRTGQAVEQPELITIQEPVQATCSCGSGIPVTNLVIEGSPVTLVALPLIFENLHQQGKPPIEATQNELLDIVKIYNPIPVESESSYAKTLMDEYAAFCAQKEPAR
jgi:uncharacterized metal-binding protein